VKSAYGSDFLYGLQEHFPEEPRILTSKINSKEEIYDSIKTSWEGPMNLSPELEKLRDEIHAYALEYGLDQIETIFEIWTLTDQ
jgi:hypothetical protein